MRKLTRNCADCGAPIREENRSGRCRLHVGKVREAAARKVRVVALAKPPPTPLAPLAPHPRRAWTDADRAETWRLYQQGEPQRAIARRLIRCRKRVSIMIATLRANAKIDTRPVTPFPLPRGVRITHADASHLAALYAAYGERCSIGIMHKAGRQSAVNVEG